MGLGVAVSVAVAVGVSVGVGVGVGVAVAVAVGEGEAVAVGVADGVAVGVSWGSIGRYAAARSVSTGGMLERTTAVLPWYRTMAARLTAVTSMSMAATRTRRARRR